MKFRDIAQFPQAHYQVNVGWPMLAGWLESMAPVELDPDYQRGHVWTKQQQIAYVEYVLRGGEGGRTLYWNNPSWKTHHGADSVTELVDGKQRMQAVQLFMRNEVKAFGFFCNEFDDVLRGMCGPDFVMKVAALPTRTEVLRWYLLINAGGTPHSRDEIARVRKLLLAEELSA